MQMKHRVDHMQFSKSFVSIKTKDLELKLILKWANYLSSILQDPSVQPKQVTEECV